jgi:hypothetical protein
MKNIAKTPWIMVDRKKAEGVNSVFVEDAEGFVLCQSMQWEGRPREQAVEHAALWAAAPELFAVVRDLVGAANAAVQSERTEYEGVSAYWSKIGPDAKRVLKAIADSII